MSRHVDTIYIHCTASSHGSFDVVDGWHKSRGFNGHYSEAHKRVIHIGYHYLILNPYSDSFSTTQPVASTTDGQIVEGRPIEIIGAHVKGGNTGSVGIAYTGFSPSPLQNNSLLTQTLIIMDKYGVPIERVFGHHEYYSNNNKPLLKTCPNINMDAFREHLSIYV